VGALPGPFTAASADEPQLLARGEVGALAGFVDMGPHEEEVGAGVTFQLVLVAWEALSVGCVGAVFQELGEVGAGVELLLLSFGVDVDILFHELERGEVVAGVGVEFQLLLEGVVVGAAFQLDGLGWTGAVFQLLFVVGVLLEFGVAGLGLDMFGECDWEEEFQLCCEEVCCAWEFQLLGAVVVGVFQLDVIGWEVALGWEVAAGWEVAVFQLDVVGWEEVVGWEDAVFQLLFVVEVELFHEVLLECGEAGLELDTLGELCCEEVCSAGVFQLDVVGWEEVIGWEDAEFQLFVVEVELFHEVLFECGMAGLELDMLGEEVEFQLCCEEVCCAGVFQLLGGAVVVGAEFQLDGGWEDVIGWEDAAFQLLFAVEVERDWEVEFCCEGVCSAGAFQLLGGGEAVLLGCELGGGDPVAGLVGAAFQLLLVD
jgi:hypothetical protein